ncbi:MAG: REP-associated tyrosine transposase [Vicinamibacterales bacterium]
MRDVPNRPPRLREFAYRGLYQYFITVCVRDRRPVFTELQCGRKVADQFLRIAEDENFAVLAYCVMPDHFHSVVEGLTEDADLRRTMHRWKLVTGHWWRRRVDRTMLWQEGFFDHILREEDPVVNVIQYVVANPVRAGIVNNVMDYPLVGSSCYDLRALARDCGLDAKLDVEAGEPPPKTRICLYSGRSQGGSKDPPLRRHLGSTITYAATESQRHRDHVSSVSWCLCGQCPST